MNCDPLDDAIVIIGSPRSGTTLLGKVLARHPALTYLNEPRLTWRYGNDGKSDLLRPDDARPEVVRHIRGEFTRRLQGTGRLRLLEKTPSNALRMAFVERVLPGCRFVHILRDPVETVLSIRSYWEGTTRSVPVAKLRARAREVTWRQAPYYARELWRRVRASAGGGRGGAWGPRVPGLEAMMRELSTLELAAVQWRWCVEAACQRGRELPPQRYLEVRLEDFGEGLLRRVCGFCGLDWCGELEAALAEYYRPDEPRRSRGVDEAELERVRRWIEPTAKWLEATQVASSMADNLTQAG